MAHWNLPAGLQLGTEGTARNTAGTTLTGVAVTPGDAAKGAWTEVVAATGHDATTLALIFHTTFTSGNAGKRLLDIGVGAAAAETVIVSNLVVGAVSSANNGEAARLLWLPVSIPAGSRIAVRAQAPYAGSALRVLCDYYGGSPLFGGQAPILDPLGVTEATTSATALAPNAVANTWGAWTDIVASTAVDYSCFIPQIQGGWATAVNTAGNLTQIGWGSAGNEVVLTTFYSLVSNTELMTLSGLPPLLPGAPGGTRLCARTQSTVGGQTSMAVALHGLRG